MIMGGTKMMMCVFLALLTVVGTSAADEEATTSRPDDDPTSPLDALEGIVADCADDVPCAKRRLSGLVARLDERPSVELVAGLATLERTSEEPSNATGDEEDLDSRLARYLRTHVLEVRLSQGAEEVVSRVLRRGDLGVGVVTSEDQSEGRGRIRKLVLPLLLLLNLKSFVLVPVFLSAVMLVAFKGLWAGLAAFLVSGVIGLRQLFRGGEDPGPSTRFTVGVVKPHIVPEVYHHAGPDYWHGWSRAGPPPHDVYPYRGYYPSSSAGWGRPAPVGDLGDLRGAWGDRPL